MVLTSPEEWTKAHFQTKTKCDILLNNLCESFNSTIMEAREKPILMLLDNIRYYLMMRMEARRKWMQVYFGTVCPKIQKKLEEIKVESGKWVGSCAGELRFEVKCRNIGQFVVSLDKHECNCRKWELSGLPCAHAVAAIAERGDDVEAYVSEWYRPATYLKAYEQVIGPVNGEDKWPKSTRDPVLPPDVIRLPGRPKKVRRREPDEPAVGQRKQKGSRLTKAKTIMHCRLCKKAGHNSRSCPTRISSRSSQQITRDVSSNHKSQQCATQVDIPDDISHSALMPGSLPTTNMQEICRKNGSVVVFVC